MHVVVYKGHLKQLGPGVSEASKLGPSIDYAYIEFTDGRMVRKVGVVGGLDGKLTAAAEEDGEVELHVLECGTKSNLLLAVKTGDGKIFATDMSQGRGGMYALVFIATGVGLALMPFLGLGLIFLWFAWRMWKSLRCFIRAADHIRALPGVIVI